MNQIDNMKVNGKFIPENKIFFSQEQTDFLKENYKTMTNQQLAETLGVKLTVMRNYKSSLGLMSSNKPINWSTGEIRFLVENYHKHGDVELAEMLNERYYYKNRNFTKKHIQKKRSLIGLVRTEKEQKLILNRNVKQGRHHTNVKTVKVADKPFLNKIYSGSISFD